MMKAADGLPQIRRSATKLGVRVEGVYAGMHPDAGGRVRPREGGMSVTIDDRMLMPTIRRPRWIGVGASKHPLFVLDVAGVPPTLGVRRETDEEEDPARFARGLVEPAVAMSLARYEHELAGTRPRWREESPDGRRA